MKQASSKYSISLPDFNVLLSAHPRKFKREVVREAVERSDVPADEVAAPAPPVKIFWFLTDTKRIFPKGAKFSHVPLSADAMAEDIVVAVLAMLTLAAPVLGGAAPWSVQAAAAGGAMHVDLLSAAETWRS